MRRWKALGFAPSLLSTWADGAAIYNTLSGETHVLSPFASETLLLISARPLSSREIEAELRSAVGDDEPGLGAALDHLLVELDRLGLVEPVDS